MNQAKTKDRILADIKAFKPLNEIEGLDKHLPELERDGLVKVWSNEQGKPITLRLTKNGESFVLNGGYRSLRRKKITNKSLTALPRFAKWLLAALLLALIASISDKIIDRLWPQ